MRSLRPRVNPRQDLRQLQLSPTEGYLLSRVDGNTTVEQLVALVRLPEERVQEILGRLVREGIVTLQPQPASAPQPAGEGPASARGAATPPDAATSPASPLQPEGAEEGEGAATHRKLFEARLHPLEEEARVALASSCSEPELSALCFDPLPRVIGSLLHNLKLGLVHARLIAAHHREPRGLEALAGRAELARDVGVQRLLLRNPQLPEGLLRRLLGGRRMLELHKVCISREATERARRIAAQALRQRFSTGPAEERVELILQTEGRALGALAGIAVDGKTAALLCARPFHSTQLILNIARWAAAPPPLIAHLLKQPLVRRQPQLRAALARHPNAPSGP